MRLGHPIARCSIASVSAVLRVASPRRLARILPVLIGPALVVSLIGVAPVSAASGTPINTVTATITVGSGPNGVAVNPIAPYALTLIDEIVFSDITSRERATFGG